MKKFIKNQNQNGIALMMVLGCLVVMTTIVLALMAISNSASRSAFILAGRGTLRYDAESATSRALWLYLWDRKNFTGDHTGLGRELTERGAGDGEPILANGQGKVMLSLNKELDGISVGKSDVVIALNDAVQGRDLNSDMRPGLTMRRDKFIVELEDAYTKEQMERFTFALDDYIDRDEYYSHPDYKYEAEDYFKDGLADFPANNRLQYIQEVYWLPNIEYFMSGVEGKLIEDNFRVLPPRSWNRGPNRAGSIASYSNKKASLLSTSSNAIELAEGLDSATLEELEKFKRGEILWDDLSEDAKLAFAKYSRDESGFLTILATAVSHDGEVVRSLKTVYDCNSLFKGGTRTPRLFHSWETILY